MLKLINLLKNKIQYKFNKEFICCPYILSGLSFTYEHIKLCCAVKQGPVLVQDYKGEPINWSKVKKERKKLIERFKKSDIPECCKGCVELKKSSWQTNSKIEHLYLNHWTHCDSGCIYCANIAITKGKITPHPQKSEYYNVEPVLKDLVKKKNLSKNAKVHFLGGDIGVLEEFNNLIGIINKNPINKIFLSTSGVKYFESLEKSIQEQKTYIVVSVDSGSEETYCKIKRTRNFNKVIKNIGKYAKNDLGDGKQQITMKYIIIDGINDNIEEIEKWLQLAKSLGIRIVRLDIDFRKYTYETEKLPPHYYDLFAYVEKRAKELNLYLSSYNYADKILEKCAVTD